MSTSNVKKSETNVQFVKRLMEFSNSGALAQLFILDAISKHADRIAETPIEELREAFGESFISADGWHAAAVEIKAAYDKRHTISLDDAFPR